MPSRAGAPPRALLAACLLSFPLPPPHMLLLLLLEPPLELLQPLAGPDPLGPADLCSIQPLMTRSVRTSPGGRPSRSSLENSRSSEGLTSRTHLQLGEGHHHVLSVALEGCAGVPHQEQLRQVGVVPQTLHAAQATHKVHRQIQLLQALTAWGGQNKGWKEPSPR